MTTMLEEQFATRNQNPGARTPNNFRPGEIANAGVLWKRETRESREFMLSGEFMGKRIALFINKNRKSPKAPAFTSQESQKVDKETIAKGYQPKAMPGPSFWEAKAPDGTAYLQSITRQSDYDRGIPGVILEIWPTDKRSAASGAPDMEIFIRQMTPRPGSKATDNTDDSPGTVPPAGEPNPETPPADGPKDPDEIPF